MLADEIRRLAGRAQDVSVRGSDLFNNPCCSYFLDDIIHNQHFKRACHPVISPADLRPGAGIHVQPVNHAVHAAGLVPVSGFIDAAKGIRSPVLGNDFRFGVQGEQLHHGLAVLGDAEGVESRQIRRCCHKLAVSHLGTYGNSFILGIVVVSVYPANSPRFRCHTQNGLLLGELSAGACHHIQFDIGILKIHLNNLCLNGNGFTASLCAPHIIFENGAGGKNVFALQLQFGLGMSREGLGISDDGKSHRQCQRKFAPPGNPAADK
ncbi:hypothetical protein D3C75_860680 [compost metagenome]